MGVHVAAGTPCQPCFHCGVLVRGVVVEDQMHVEVGGDAGVDVAQESEELLMTMAPLALREDFTALNVEGREERRGPVPRVVMRDAFDVAEAHGQVGLRPLQRLDLALFIDAQHVRVVGRIEIETNDVPHLLYEERIGGELEMPSPMWLLSKGGQSTVAPCLVDAGLKAGRPPPHHACGGGRVAARRRYPRVDNPETASASSSPRADSRRPPWRSRNASPSADRSTIFARRTSPAGIEGERTMRSSSVRSTSANTKWNPARRPRGMAAIPERTPPV